MSENRTHVALEDEVMLTLERPQRTGLSAPVRAIVGAILDEPRTDHGTSVDDVIIDNTDPASMLVTVRLIGGDAFALVVHAMNGSQS